MNPAFDAYLAPARPRAALWRLVLGLILIIGCWVASTVLLMAGFVLLRLAMGAEMDAALSALGAFLQAEGPGPVIFQLATFIGIWPGVWLALRLLHRQPFMTAISPEGRMRWRDFFGGLGLAAAFWVPSILLGIIFVGWPSRTGLDLSTRLLNLPVLAVVIFLQASGEELVFRGYALQQLALRLRSPLIWALLPAFLFGLAHYANGEAIGVGWQYVFATTLFGATAAALVWRTGSLAGAMGLHTGMNLLALGGVGVEGVIEGTQLFLYPPGDASVLFMIDEVATLGILLLILSPWCPIRPRTPTPDGSRLGAPAE